MSRIRPGPGKIAVRVLQASDMTEAGLWLPESAKNEGHMGEVIATCGPYEENGKEYENDYQVGETVVFGKYNGTEVKIGRDSFIILRESEILCVVEDDKSEDPAVIPIKS